MKSRKEQLISGFRIAALGISGFVVFGLLLWSAGVVFGRLEGPKGPAWMALLVAVGVTAYTVDRWRKALPGLLLLGAFNALVMASSGHMINNPKIAVPREVSISAALLLVTSSILSAHFYDKPLRLVDRAALLSFVGFTLFGMLSDFVVTSLLLGALVLFVGYANNKIWHGRIKNSRAAGSK